MYRSSAFFNTFLALSLDSSIGFMLTPNFFIRKAMICRDKNQTAVRKLATRIVTWHSGLHSSATLLFPPCDTSTYSATSVNTYYHNTCHLSKPRNRIPDLIFRFQHPPSIVRNPQRILQLLIIRMRHIHLLQINQPLSRLRH